MVRNKISNKGFTLVELLVVVAIIGILATAGIPQYRRMVQSAKKSEAKVMLGEIGTANAAFFAEWGTFGSNLGAMGAEMDAVANAQRIYTAGFMDAGCAATIAIFPPNTLGTVADQINLSSPAYFGGPYQPRLGRFRTGACVAASTVLAATYTANAAGSIRGGAALADGIADRWTIDQNRLLTNTFNGSD